LDEHCCRSELEEIGIIWSRSADVSAQIMPLAGKIAVYHDSLILGIQISSIIVIIHFLLLRPKDRSSLAP
jgi:hypothetical protein